jgi:glycerol-3-phosphate dehydrogenase
MPKDIAKHLIHTYGTTSIRIIDLGNENEKQKLKGTNQRIHPDYPFLKSEISYAVKHELAEKPNDVLCRRVPIAFLDSKAAHDLLPEVIEIMAKEKSWSAERIK